MNNDDLQTMTIKELEAEQKRLFNIIPGPGTRMTSADQDLIERMFQVTDLLEAE
jgi:hypothetical protein